MIRLLPVIVPGVVFSLLPTALAEPVIAEKINAYVRTEMERQRIPGLAVAVVEHGKITFHGEYGFSNLEHQVPVKAETVFQSGSVAKQFTATAVMMLVEEGRLSLDDTLSRHFPDSPASWSKITVRHLLSHTSGMADYPKDFDLRRDHTEDEYLAIIKAAPLTFAPGERWDYSNLGYVTLGILIHKVTGQFYGDFLAERVFQPLGMTTARVISEADLVPNRAASYRLVNGELKNVEWVSPTTNSTADGALYFTILDLARWDAALYTDTPLPRAVLARMWTPATLNNGQPTALWLRLGHRAKPRTSHGVSRRRLAGVQEHDRPSARRGTDHFAARQPGERAGAEAGARTARPLSAKIRPARGQGDRRPGATGDPQDQGAPVAVVGR